MSTRQLCTCYIDDNHFAFPAEQVQEVVRRISVFSMPLMPNGVGGLVNLRGQIMIAIDLRERFGDGPMDLSGSKSLVVLSDRRFCVIVDRVGDVMSLDQSLFESTPANVDERIAQAVLGAYKLENALLMLLDVSKTIADVEARSQESKNTTLREMAKTA